MKRPDDPDSAPCFLIVLHGGAVLPVHGPAWLGILRGAIGTDHLADIDTPDGPYKLWSADVRYYRPKAVNVVASLFGPQFGLAAVDSRMYDTVAITHAEAPTEPGDAPLPLPDPDYALGLLADIRAAWRGEPVSAAVTNPAWPDAIRLAGAWLSDPRVSNGLHAPEAQLHALATAPELTHERSRP